MRTFVTEDRDVAGFAFRMPTLVMAIGTASYSIYLIHFLFISAGNKVLTRLLPDLPGIAALVLLVGLAGLGGYLYFLVAERPIERWRRGLRRRTRGGPTHKGREHPATSLTPSESKT